MLGLLSTLTETVFVFVYLYLCICIGMSQTPHYKWFSVDTDSVKALDIGNTQWAIVFTNTIDLLATAYIYSARGSNAQQK